jgi:hypothetical protein
MSIASLQTEERTDTAFDERWEAVQRIVQSEQFQKSPRLCRLLIFLAEQSLLDRPMLLTEHNIAAVVFDRTTGFDPGVDTIVRSQMVRLRQKLDQYAVERSPLSCHVTVPRGEYRVRFECADKPQPEPALPPPDPTRLHTMGGASIVVTREPTPRGLYWIILILGFFVLLLGAALIAVIHHAGAGKAASLHAVSHHPLWDHIFQPERKTILVSADSGLVLLHHLTGKRTTLAQYLNHDFSQQTQGLPQQRIDEILDLAGRRYTSFVDLNLFRRIDHLPYAATGHLEVKYARDVNINDLKQGNVILSGAQEANPWLDLYESEMNFVGDRDAPHGSYRLHNRKPLPGEATEYDTIPGDPGKHVLGILAYLSNLDGDGNALIVEGSNMAGTEAISDFLFDDSALLPFLEKIRDKDGTLQHFEVVIQSTSVNGSAGPISIVAYRVHR